MVGSRTGFCFVACVVGVGVGAGLLDGVGRGVLAWPREKRSICRAAFIPISTLAGVRDEGREDDRMSTAHIKNLPSRVRNIRLLVQPRHGRLLPPRDRLPFEPLCCPALPCPALLCPALRYATLRCPELPCSALRCAALLYPALLYPALR